MELPVPVRGDEEAGAQGGFPCVDLPMGSWSEPPRDVLECILDKLKEHRDVLLFSSVSAAWRSFVSENLQRFPRQLPLARCLPEQCQIPLLMLPSEDATKPCDFFCVFEQKFYGGMPLPDSNKWIWGSSHGWLVTADIRGPEIYLFNPISRHQIHLPSKTQIPRPNYDTTQFGLETFFYLPKAALSQSPASNIEDCAVMAIVSGPCVLSFCRPGDSKWTNVPDSPIAVEDVITYKEQFYAVTAHGVVVTCDIGPSPKATAVIGRLKLYVDDDISEIYFSQKRYLVESRGELLQVVRISVEDGVLGVRTADFKVFRLQEKGSEEDYEEEKGSEEDEEDEDVEKYENIDGKIVPVENSRYKWVELNNLCDQIIFLGFNQSLSLPVAALPNSRGNCIYFIDDNIDRYYARFIEGDVSQRRDDMGVFNMEDRSVHRFHPKDLVFTMPPVWVSPTLW